MLDQQVTSVCHSVSTAFSDLEMVDEEDVDVDVVALCAGSSLIHAPDHAHDEVALTLEVEATNARTKVLTPPSSTVFTSESSESAARPISKMWMGR